MKGNLRQDSHLSSSHGPRLPASTEDSRSGNLKKKASFPARQGPLQLLCKKASKPHILVNVNTVSIPEQTPRSSLCIRGEGTHSISPTKEVRHFCASLSRHPGLGLRIDPVQTILGMLRQNSAVDKHSAADLERTRVGCQEPLGYRACALSLGFMLEPD